MGISAQEVSDCSEILEISDEYATFDDRGRVVWDMEHLEQIPIYKRRVDY